MNVKRYKPHSMVTFYTEEGDLVARSTGDPNSDIDQDVISINTSRDMGNDSPTFTINLTRRRDWHKWVASNDLVKIQMSRPPESSSTVFVGLVDDCRKRVVLSGDSVQRVVTVTGRGVAKAFIKFDIGVVPEAEYASYIAGWIQARGVNISGQTARDIINSVWDDISKEFVNYKWSNGKTLWGEIEKSVTNRDNLILLDDSNIIKWQGSLWGLFREIGEDPFYEVFWEVLDGKPTMVVRPTPFSKENWNNLPTSRITDEDVVVDEVGRSDVETYTLYSVGAKSIFSSHDTYRTLGVLPYWYEPYGNKYGINRLQVNTAYMSVTNEDDTTTSANIMRQLQNDLFDWNIKNNSMWNGTLVVKGKNSYKIGTRLIYGSVEDGSTMEYYITSVSHNFVNYGTWSTELGVTRGMSPSDRFTAPYGMATEYEGLGLVGYDPESSRHLMEQDHTGGSYSEATGNAIVDGARAEMNTGRIWYDFGGNDPESGRLDCSSFTQYIYKKYANVDIGRVTGQQVLKGTAIDATPTDTSNLLPGDLVFFKDTYDSVHIYGVSHVGIYSGNGYMIHNSSGAGGVVETLLNTSYYRLKWLGARRVITHNTTIVDSEYNDLVDKKIANILMPIRVNSHKLGGKLTATYDLFTRHGSSWGVNPILMAAIAMHETGNGTSTAIKNRNNVGGLMYASGGLQTFDTIEDGIDMLASVLKRLYIDEGLLTIRQIQKKYAPVGAENDPNNLNANWVNGVSKYYNDLTKP